MTRYMRSLGLDEHAANDVIQDVFVRLLQAMPGFQLDGKRGRFRSYLWKLTYSVLVDQARRVKSRRRAEETWIDRFLEASEAESRKVQEELNEINRQQILERAIARVRAETSPKAWTCFEQRLLRDRPGTAIAAELGISDKAVFVYASRVLKAVRARCASLAEDLENEPVDWLPRRTWPPGRALDGSASDCLRAARLVRFLSLAARRLPVGARPRSAAARGHFLGGSGLHRS